MILYVDTSALVKLYVAEEGSETIREAVNQAGAVATFRSEWHAYSVVNVTQPVAELAAELAEAKFLCGFHVIHLASSPLIHQRTRETVQFLAWDKALLRAACDMGLDVVVP